MKKLFLIALAFCSLTAFAQTASEYCRASFGTGAQACRISWETLANGNVEITLFEPDGSVVAGTHFRGNGVNIARLTVGGEPAATYFTSQVNAASNVQTLALIDPANAPAAGAVIAYPSSTVEYAVVGDGNAWPSFAFNYTYGGICVALDAPTNVAVAADGTITFDAVTDAETYEAHVYDGSYEAYVGTVTNGGKINYQVYVAKTLTVKLVAKAAGKADSDFSDPATWNATASPLPASAWCERAGVATAKNNWGDAHFTLNTQANGNVLVEISSPDGTAAHFRGGAEKKGMNGTFKLNGSTAEFNTYFTVVKAADNSTVTLTLVDPANKPAIGSIIDYSGQIECATSQNGDDWSNYDILGYIYGTTCPTDVAVTGVTLDQTTASVPVNKTLTLKATVAPNNAANKNVTWSSSVTTVATVADGVVTPVAEGTTVITVTTEDGGFTASCTVTVGPAQVLAPTTPAPTPTIEAAKVMSIYSDAYTPCVTIGNINIFNQPWWGNPTLTEEEIGGNHMLHYTGNMGGMIGWEHAHINIATMNKVHVDIWAQENGTLTMGPTSANPTVVANKVLTLVGGQWNSFDLDLATDFDKTLDLTDMFQNQFTGYSAQENLFIDNYFYYTTQDADTEKPVMTSASLESVSFTSAILNVAATDNRGVTKYIVKNGATEIGKFSPADGKITVTGLADGTAYTLSVYAEDAAENVSDNHVEVSLTTLTMPEAAADPDVTNVEYVSVFAPSLTNMLAHGFALQNWGSANGVKVDAKGYFFYHTANNTSIVWGENNAGANAIVAVDEHKGDKGNLDASEMEYMHFDIWADKDGCNSLIVVINDHNLGDAQTLDAGWNSIDIALSEFGATPDNNWLLDNVAWIKFVGLNNTNDIAVTNVYFWKPTTPTAIDNLETVKAVKVIENGQIVIIRDGVRYNAQGARL